MKIKVAHYPSLTKEQEARFPEFVRKWTEIGLSTAPLNRARILDALTRAFREVNKPPPRLVVCSSPLASTLTRAVLASVRASVSDSVLASVSASVLDSVRDSVSDSVSASVRASVLDSVRDSVSASVLDSVRASVLDSVRDSVSASVLDSVRDSVSDSVRASVREIGRASCRERV